MTLHSTLLFGLRLLGLSGNAFRTSADKRSDRLSLLKRSNSDFQPKMTLKYW
jgi:hypothetical protein